MVIGSRANSAWMRLVASGVDVCQGVARDSPPNAHVVELVALGTRTSFDVAQTFPAGQPGKGHAEKLTHPRKRLYVPISIVLFDAFAKRMQGQVVHRLRENKSLCRHDRAPSGLERSASAPVLAASTSATTRSPGCVRVVHTLRDAPATFPGHRRESVEFLVCSATGVFW